jgi:hypothetical protein
VPRRPGEILVPSTVRDLVVGSGTGFEDRGQCPPRPSKRDAPVGPRPAAAHRQRRNPTPTRSPRMPANTRPPVAEKQPESARLEVSESSASLPGESHAQHRHTIDSELRLVAAFRRSARERGGPLPSIDVADALLDERRKLTGSSRLSRTPE